MSAFTEKINKTKVRGVDVLFFCIFIILSFGVFLWFKKPNSIVLAGDFGWPLDFNQFLHTTFSSWDSRVNFGYLATRQNSFFFPYAVYGALLQNLFSSPHYVQMIIFYLSFLSSCLGTYLFLLELSKNRFGSFLGGLFYAINPYALSVMWNPSYGITFPFYTWLPLSLYCILKIVKANNLKVVILFSIIIESLPLGFSFGNPVFFILFILISFSIFLITFIKSNFSAQSRNNYLIFVFLYFIFNVFWIVPFVANIHYEFSSATNAPAGLMSDKDTLKLNSINFTDAFQTSGVWALKAGNLGDDYYDWKGDLSNPVYIVSQFAPILAVLFFLINKKRRGKNMTLAFFLLSYIFFIFLNSAYLKGGVYEKIVNLVFFHDFLIRSFRSIFLKLGTLLALSATVLLAETINIESLNINLNAKKAIFILTLTLLIVFTLGKPYAFGQVIKSAGKILPPYSITIPKEYLDFSKFAKKNLKEGRILSLPLPKSYNVLLNWGKDNGYNGADFLRYYIDNPLIYVNFDNGTLNKFIQTVLTNQDPSIYFSILNIRYIFVRKDTPAIVNDNYLLLKIPDITGIFHKIYSTQYFDLYEIKQNLYTPHIYIPTSFKYVKSIEVSSFKTNVPKIAILNDSRNVRQALNGYLSDSSRAAIKYTEISPTLYKINVQTNSARVPLVFSEAFSEGWKINIRNKLTSQKSHFLVNGFGNFWLLNKKEICYAGNNCTENSSGEYKTEFFIEYEPQRIFEISFLLSSGLILFCIGYVLMSAIKLQKNVNK